MDKQYVNVNIIELMQAIDWLGGFMIEFNELKNAQKLIDDTYEMFERLPNRDIKKTLGDALFLINHFIDLNKPAVLTNAIHSDSEGRGLYNPVELNEN